MNICVCPTWPLVDRHNLIESLCPAKFYQTSTVSFSLKKTNNSLCRQVPTAKTLLLTSLTSLLVRACVKPAALIRLTILQWLKRLLQLVAFKAYTISRVAQHRGQHTRTGTVSLSCRFYNIVTVSLGSITKGPALHAPSPQRPSVL